ncbi:hypothetical protein [Bernardetia sp.]|uniref:hypothetical protein n=1 Tax=Bernardetia sp. TaxID=1937974 RepID=UPI0025C30300|nr:hypothetical protein [Bernardetia sp.]
MLEKIFNNWRNQKWMFISLLLTSIGIYFFGIFDPNQVVLSVASENTPPTRFDVEFGAFKVNQKMHPSFKTINYNDCCVDAANEVDFYEGGEFAYNDVYVVTFDSVMLKRQDYSFYPKIRVGEHKVIHVFLVRLYFIILFIAVSGTIYVVSDFFIKES